MAKGGDWEREASKILSRWWTSDLADDVIWHTSGSGGRATTRRKAGKNTVNASGDLCYTDRSAKSLFDFMLIECKRGYTTHMDKKVGKRVPAPPSQTINALYWIDRLPNTNPPVLYQWWQKLDEERRAAGAWHQCIIFKRTSKRSCIMIGWPLFTDLINYCNEYPGATLTLSMPPVDGGNWGEYVIMDLESFLDWVSPETIELMLEDHGGPKQAPKPKKRQL